MSASDLIGQNSANSISREMKNNAINDKSSGSMSYVRNHIKSKKKEIGPI